MAAPVWTLSVNLEAKTATFQSGMSEAAKSARGAFTDIKSGSSEMGGHVNTNMFAARHSVMALSEAFGGQLPRAITAFIAHIGPLGALLEAAFPFAAIALGAVLLLEHLAKLHAEGVKLTEDQVKFGTAVQLAFNSLDQKLISAGIRSDELRNDHLGALHLQLQLIDKQSMAELVHSFSEVAVAADTVFEDLKTHWYQWGIGAEGAKHALKVFQDEYGSLLAQGKSQEASDLLKGTRESAAHILAMMKQAKDNSATPGGGNNTAASELLLEQARGELRKAGVNNTEKEVQAQQILVDALNAQVEIAGKVAALKKADSGNATATTGKELAGLQAEAGKQAAEHTQKMNELMLGADKEASAAAMALHEASIAEKLQADVAFAAAEMRIQLQGNGARIAALDKSGKDYNNQLHALQDKGVEIVAQHEATVSDLMAKAAEATNREALLSLEQSERAKIEATQAGSNARLAAIDAALKEEQAKGLESTQFYRDLQNERVQVQRQADEESAKLAQEAGKESSDNELKMGELALAAARTNQTLADSARRLSSQQRLTEEVKASNDENALKMRAMQHEIDTLDKGGKDYANKLKELQDKQRQLVQQHENDITQIKAKAEEERNTRILSAERQAAEQTASGLTQSIMGHQSWARTLDSLGNQMAEGMIRNSLMVMMQQDKERLGDARKAATSAYATGEKIGGPAGIVLGPVFAAAAFAGAMAFADGGIVPGVGHGDTVPAMLTPGEGVVPGGVMDGLRKMAVSGTMGGGTHYHVAIHSSPNMQALDSDGMAKVLDNHTDAIAKHVSNELRKLNR